MRSAPTRVLQVVVVGLVELGRSDLALRLPAFLPQIVDGGANLFDFGVGELDGVHHRFFLHFLGAGLDHHDAVGGADHHDVQQALAHLGVSRVDDECAIHQTYADGADGAFERNVGDGQCGRGAIDAEDVRVIFGVGGEDEGDDLGFAAEAIREQGPHGAVNLAAGENFTLAGAAFALDEAAGDASAGVGVFAIVNGQGEEIDAFAGIGIGGGGGQNDVIANAHYH